MHARWPMTAACSTFLLFLVLSLANLNLLHACSTHRSHSSDRTLARLPEGAHFAHRTASLSTRAPSELVAGTRGLRNATRFIIWFRIAQPPHDAPSFRSIVSG